MSRALTFLIAISAASGSFARCYNRTEVSLEFVLVQKATETSFWKHPINRHELSSTLESIASSIESAFTTPKLGVVGFHNFGAVDSDHAGCYRHYTNIQESGAWAQASDALLNDPHTSDTESDNDSSLAAAMLAVTRGETGFTTGPFDKNKKRMIRAVAVVTDAIPTLGGGVYKKSPPFQADGSDTCKNDAPTLDEIAKILKMLDMHLIIYAPAKTQVWWKAAQSKLGPSVMIRENDDIYKLSDAAVMKDLDEILCEVGPVPSTPSPAPSTDRTTPTSPPPTSGSTLPPTSGSHGSGTTAHETTTTSGATHILGTVSAAAAMAVLLSL